jgi:hemerythrin-like metal-binding protein
MIAWSEDFATHIEFVDSQHKKLFELINDLSESYHKTGPSEASVDKVLKELVAYANKHFSEEEQLMLDYKVDPRHVKVHRMSHKSFIYDVNILGTYLSTEEDILVLTHKLVCFLSAWLTYHILGTDRIMAAQLFAIKQGESPEKAYELRNTVTYNPTVTRLMLDSVLDLWRASAERCFKLEEKLAALSDKSK